MLTIGPTLILDAFAEAFPMTAARAVVTAATPGWARTAAAVATGYATSVIGCDAEAGVEGELSPAETPDGRPGVSVLLFAFSRDALAKAAVNRVAQCVLTCATTACYNGLPVTKDRSIRMLQLENSLAAAKKWNGQLPLLRHHQGTVFVDKDLMSQMMQAPAPAQRGQGQ